MSLHTANLVSKAQLPGTLTGSQLIETAGPSALTVDGVAVSVGDEILLVNQEDSGGSPGRANENGIWIVLNTGSGFDNWVLRRRPPLRFFSLNDVFFVTGGVTDADTFWRLIGIRTDSIDVGTTLLTFDQKCLNCDGLTFKVGTVCVSNKVQTDLIEAKTDDLVTIEDNMLINGNLTVEGNHTSISTVDLIIEDNVAYLGQGYTTNASRTGGLVVNCEPTAVATTSAAGGFSSNANLEVTDTTGFAANDFVQISSTQNQENSGLFELSSIVPGAPGTITIKAVGVAVDFVQNTFAIDASDTTAVITKVKVATLLSSDDCIWESGRGADSTAHASSVRDLVMGALSSTDSNIALWDGTDGNRIKDSVVNVDGAGNVTGVNNITVEATVFGGSAANDDLTLESTSNGAKGCIILKDAAELQTVTQDDTNTRLLVWDSGTQKVEWRDITAGGQLDHGLHLTGLGDDDHTQYLLLAGRSGGQLAIGGTDANDDLTLESTANGTKGCIIVKDETELQTVNQDDTQTRMLVWDSVSEKIEWRASSTLGADIHHDTLVGLGDDDHTQYALLAGRATGQTLNGGTAASEDLTLDSTTNVTKGYIVHSSSLKAPDGTAALPSYTFTSDATTGMYMAGSGALSFTQDGTSTLEIDTASRLLISSSVGIDGYNTVYQSADRNVIATKDHINNIRDLETFTRAGTGALTNPDVTNGVSSKKLTFYSTTAGGAGNATATLGDGSVAGQLKYISATAVDAGSPIVITVTSFGSDATITFSGRGGISLVWDGLDWQILGSDNVAIA